MNRPRLARALRITWTAFFGFAAVLLCVLWVRSYWWNERIMLRGPTVTYGGIVSTITSYSDIGSNDGKVYFGNYGTPSLHALSNWSYENERSTKEDPSITTLGFGFERTWLMGSLLVLPYWFLLFTSAAFGTASWLPWWSSRFSLRTLLIATTLIGLGLGMVAWLR